jgi:hypothetical protein
VTRAHAPRQVAKARTGIAAAAAAEAAACAALALAVAEGLGRCDAAAARFLADAASADGMTTPRTSIKHRRGALEVALEDLGFAVDAAAAGGLVPEAQLARAREEAEKRRAAEKERFDAEARAAMTYLAPPCSRHTAY